MDEDWWPTYRNSSLRGEHKYLKSKAERGDADAQLTLAALFLSCEIGRPSFVVLLVKVCHATVWKPTHGFGSQRKTAMNRPRRTCSA